MHRAWVAVLSGLVVSSSVDASESIWIGGDGAWDDGSNWESGMVPDATRAACVGNDGEAIVTGPANACGSLTIGLDLDEGRVSIEEGGLLAVADDVAVGVDWLGVLVLTEGSLVVGGDVTVGALGAVSLGSTKATGVSAVGALTVDGLLTLVGPTTINSFASMSMSSPATLNAALLPNGIAPINISGAIALNGTLQVTDLGVPEGDYVILSGASVTGTFDDTDFPDEGWSWFVDGADVIVRKDDVTPADRARWGEIKRTFE